MRKNYFAISGVKNSGKTTLIAELVKEFNKKGYSVSTIKHDGSDFDPDLPGTDSYIHREAGASNVAIYSKYKYQIIKKDKRDFNYFIELFKDTDIIILEGFKDEDLPKIEVIREANSKEAYCKDNYTLGYYTDIKDLKTDKKIFEFGEVEKLADYLIDFLNLKNR